MEMIQIQDDVNLSLGRGRFSKYSRGLRQPFRDYSTSSQRKHGLPALIFVAFLIGFFVGKRESTPADVSAVVGKLGELVGFAQEPSIDQLLGQLTKARMNLEERFTIEYGEYYGRLFDPIQLDNIFSSSKISKDRLKRQLMIKILNKLLFPSKEVKFTWATAGDSIAAGHGNMFNQSYTAMLEDTVADAFAALGIQFVARNYGMAMYSSAPELALCMEAVYGNDLDVLVWDFGLADVGHDHRALLWGQRAMLHPTRPILFFVDSLSSVRHEIITKFEKEGMSSILYDKVAVDVLRATRIPLNTDTAPPALQYLMCNGAVEGSLPCDDALRFFMCEQLETAQQCWSNKYHTLPGCDNSQKSIHPGWKEHLLRGRLFGHYLLELLEEALLQLDALKHPNGKQVRSQFVLDNLLANEESDAKTTKSSRISAEYLGGDKALMADISLYNLFRVPTICHTALLPSESRFLGYPLESSMKGDFRGGFDVGQSKVLAVPKAGKLPLVYDGIDRARCASPKIDHKDYFMFRNQDDWLDMVVPNKAEIQAYRRANSPPKGIFIICMQVCPLGVCSDDTVTFGDLSKDHTGSKIDIRVDGRPVKRVKKFDGCHVLEHNSGIRWGEGKAGDGQYKLSFNLHVSQQGLNFVVKISSIILF